MNEIDYNFSNNVNNNYLFFQEELSRSFTEVIFDIINNGNVLTNEKFNKIKRQYQEYMEIDVPEEMDEIYRSMGFSNNGHKKFCVITWSLKIGGFLLETRNQEIAKLMRLFDERDLRIIKNSLDKYLEKNNL
jgi:hypothetical protein